MTPPRMDALDRVTTLERAGHVAPASRSRGASFGASGPRATPPVTPPPTRGPARSHPEAHPEGGARMPVVLIASLGAHALFAAALTVLPAASSAVQQPHELIEIRIDQPPVAIPEPAPIPEPVIEPEPAPEPVAVREVRRERLEPAAPEPPAAAVAASTPPPLDEVFAEAPPPLPTLTGAGPGSFAVPEGSPEGAAGGRGRTVGAPVTASSVGPSPQEPGPRGPSPDEVRRARRAYADQIRELLGRAARYPVPARRGGIEGRVVVALRIAEDGRLIAARVTSSCGYSMLDEAALAAANDLSRVPAPPALVAWRSADELRVPIVFEITR